MTRKFVSLVVMILSVFVCFSLKPTRAAPTAPTFMVNSPADVVASAPLDNGVCETAPGNGVCTLRAAIMKANHYPGGGATIKFALSGVVTYTLTIPPSDFDDEASGDLNITNTLTISGNGAGNTIIDANHIDRVFLVASLPATTISGVTIKNGYPTGPGSGTLSSGGGIQNGGNLMLINSTISGNTVDGTYAAGGGIASTGVLTITNSIVSGNTAGSSDGEGGGIFAVGPLTLVNSTVSGNTSGENGGGLLLEIIPAAIINSAINGNIAGVSGGGIYSSATLSVINSTISSNNSNANGGGIYNFVGTTSLFNATVTNNLANADSSGVGLGGGVVNATGVVVNFRNSIIGKNYSIFVSGFPILNIDDCLGTITSQGNNILSTTTDCTVSGRGVTVADPMLGPLANNGGSTQTHALLTGSPAIDAGDAGGCTDNLGAILTTDQRGFHRPVFGESALRCDIGAFEVQRLLYLPFITN